MSSDSVSRTTRMLNAIRVIRFGLHPIEVNNSVNEVPVHHHHHHGHHHHHDRVLRIDGTSLISHAVAATTTTTPPSLATTTPVSNDNETTNSMSTNTEQSNISNSTNHEDNRNIGNNNNNNNETNSNNHNNHSPYSLTMNLTLNIQHRDNGGPGGGGGGVHMMNDGNDPLDPLFARTRQRVYSMLLVRVALLYFLTVPNFMRKFFEYGILAAAILSFILLIHLHILFIRSPLTCLDQVKTSWPRHGILRVQIGLDDEMVEELLSNYQPTFDKQMSSTNNNVVIEQQKQKENYFNQTLPITYEQYRSMLVNNGGQEKQRLEELNILLKQFADTSMLDTFKFYPKRNGVWTDPYVVEYSLEYGLLRLSEEMRQYYKVPVMRVTLQPETDTCFGDPLARFMLNHYLGYDDVLIGSIKRLAEQENNRGYVRNVVTGEHFRFVNVWMTRTSYLASAFIMIVFTLFVSMLIRYSHQQVFVFVSEFLHTLEMQQPMTRVTFLTASLITVILALIGMETIMYEFFADSSITFHVIIMVWAADQFDSMAVRSPISRRHFLRFFYLYQFAFYAYHYRFNGQYAGLSLLTTMLFSYHSMIFFFHHYELPLLQAITGRRNSTQTPQQHTTPTPSPPPPPPGTNTSPNTESDFEIPNSNESSNTPAPESESPSSTVAESISSNSTEAATESESPSTTAEIIESKSSSINATAPESESPSTIAASDSNDDNSAPKTSNA